MASGSRHSTEQAPEPSPRAYVHMPLRESERLKRPYMVPALKHTKGTNATFSSSISNAPTIFPGFDIFYMEHLLENPVILYGQPYSGKTNLFLKLCVASSSHYGTEHFVLLLELRVLADFCKSLQRRPSSILQLIALQMNTSERILRSIFKPPPGQVRDKKRAYTGELFLDGYDEIPINERDYFNQLISKLHTECQIRVWISCRNYLKPVLSELFPGLGHLDMLRYSAQQQAEYLHKHWKMGAPPGSLTGKEERLKIFSRYIHSQLNVIVPEFAVTLGCIPIFIEATAGLFKEHLNIYLQSEEKDPHMVLIQRRGVRFTDMINKLVGKLMEFYCLKVIPVGNTDADFMKRQCTNILLLNSEYSLRTYPAYEHSIDMSVNQPQPANHNGRGMGHGNADGASTSRHGCRILDEIQRIGFLLTEDSGLVRFHHKTFGDYFLANYFEYKHSINEWNVNFDRFYLRVVLFEQNATDILMYYDTCVGNVYSELLHGFLIKHYRLGAGQEQEWAKMKENGNIWHLAIIQGFHQLARCIISSFKANEKNEMRRFFMMNAPIKSIERYAVETVNGSISFSKGNSVSSLSVLALFGYEKIVEETFQTFLQIFEPAELRSEFNRFGNWSPLHFAAAHVNLCFISQIYGAAFQKVVKIQPGVYNARGFSPLHLLISKSWYHVMQVVDVNLSDYDDMPSSVQEEPPAPTPSTSQGRPAGAEGRGKGHKKRNVGKDHKENVLAPTPCRILIRGRDFKKDFYDIPGLLETLHACIGLMVNVGGEEVDSFDVNNALTLMHRAAQDGFLETVLFLIHLGADPNLQNVAGVTPLHMAAVGGFKDVFLDLIKHGAKLTFRDHKQNSAIALWQGWGEENYFARGGRPLTKLEYAIFRCATEIDEMLDDVSNKDAIEATMERLQKELRRNSQDGDLVENSDKKSNDVESNEGPGTAGQATGKKGQKQAVKKGELKVNKEVEDEEGQLEEGNDWKDKRDK